MTRWYQVQKCSLPNNIVHLHVRGSLKISLSLHVNLRLRNLRRLRLGRWQGGFGERRSPARRARLPRGEPAVNALHVEPVVAVRQRAHALAGRELGEADGAFRRAAPGELDLARVDQRHWERAAGPSLSPGTGLAGGGGAPLPRRVGAAAPGELLRTVARAARDAERAPDHRVDREHDHQGAEEQRQHRDHRLVQRVQGRCCCARTHLGNLLLPDWPRRRGSRGGGVRQEPPCMHPLDAHLFVELQHGEINVRGK
jgi:hypothetical protein